MSSSGLTLQALFLSAQKKQEQLNHIDPGSETYKELQHATISELKDCQNLVTRTAMFSVNEEIDDISTQDIPYGSSHDAVCGNPLIFTDILQLNIC